MESSKPASIIPDGFHAVVPKKDCPHCIPENIVRNVDLKGKSVDDPCEDCGNIGENWICLHPDC